MSESTKPSQTLELSSARIDTPKARINGWLDIQRPLFEVEFEASPDVAFDWRFQLNHVGTSICGQTQCVAQQIHRSDATIASGICDHIFIDYLVDCRMEGNAGGKPFSARSGDIIIFDMARPSSFAIAPPGKETGVWHTMFMMIPRSFFQNRCDIQALHGLVLPDAGPVCHVIRAHIRALVEAASCLSSQEAEAMGSGTAAFLAQALAPVSLLGSKALGVFTDATLLRVRDYIEAHLNRVNLSPAVIAKECAISRANLYRLFEPFGGVAVYVKRQRLIRIRRELSLGALMHQTISSVSRRNGFQDDASFRRAFRRAFGTSASGVRVLKKTAAASGSGSVETTITTWIRDL